MLFEHVEQLRCGRQIRAVVKRQVNRRRICGRHAPQRAISAVKQKGKWRDVRKHGRANANQPPHAPIIKPTGSESELLLPQVKFAKDRGPLTIAADRTDEHSGWRRE